MTVTEASPSARASNAEAEAQAAREARQLERRATLLLALLGLLVAGAGLFLLHARGAFEPTQRLVLIADDSEGVVVGMNLTFSGFPIGRVRSISLADDGSVRIAVDVPRKDARWLRESSVFTLVRGVLGNTNIRAYSGVLTDPPLPDGAERVVLRGDATAELPRVVAQARELLDNASALTARGGALAATLEQLHAFSEKLNGERGAVGALLGNAREAQQVAQALERANALLARLDELVRRTDAAVARADARVLGEHGLLARADARLLGPDGLVDETRATVVQLRALLAQAQASLRQVDAVLVEAQGVGANVRGATADLHRLRADVDATLRKVEDLVNDISRRWPFARDHEVKLP